MTVPEDVPESDMCNVLILQFRFLGSQGWFCISAFQLVGLCQGMFFFQVIIFCVVFIGHLLIVACSCFPGPLLNLLFWVDDAVTCLFWG